ncbi:MAG TPA: methyl-accepting chemotaxis protein [Burkholderiales bacterium]|nr:methyl-accepting chemotaxis protein [Burkholderiales bacterium]
MKKPGFSIGRRLTVGLSIILFITAGAAGYAIWCLQDLERGYQQLTTDSMAQERNTQEWINITTLSGARNLVIAKFADIDNTQKAFTAFKLGDSTALRGRVNELQKEIFGHLTTDDGKRLVEETLAKRKVYLDILDKSMSLIKDGKKEEGQKIAETTLIPAMTAYIGSTHVLLDHTRKMIAVQQEKMHAASERARVWVAGLIALVLGLAVVIAWFLTRSITLPLKQALGVAEKVAAGDLRSHIAAGRNDETGALLAAISMMQDNLKELIGKVRSDVDAVSSSASQLAVSADELSGSAAAQNEAVTSTASSVEELTVSIAQMSGSAQIAQDVVEATVKISDSGLEMGNKVSREIGEIDRSVSDFAQQMQALQGQAGEIGTVVKLIKEIADQTNLLALNAAIEAARAGEQGRGFAVVADEVRKLAERTSSATSEIQKTIEAIQSNMGSAGNLLDNVKTRVDAGVSTIADLIEPLKTLQSQAERAASGLRELTNATKEQQQASEQIARNTEQIAASAEQNQASVSQSRDTSRELSGLAERLQASVTRFKVD